MIAGAEFTAFLTEIKNSYQPNVHGYALEDMVTTCGANVTLKEAVEEIGKEGEKRRLVFEFETKHRDEIDEILGVIDYIDKGYVRKRFPEV